VHSHWARAQGLPLRLRPHPCLRPACARWAPAGACAAPTSGPGARLLPLRRIVRTDIAIPSEPSTWPDVVPQHAKDLLQSAHALQGDNLLVEWLRDVAGGCCAPWKAGRGRRLPPGAGAAGSAD
jgi:hypothetical protein